MSEQSTKPLALLVGDVITTLQEDMIMLVVEHQIPDDPRCCRVLMLQCSAYIMWQPGEVGPVTHSALRNGGYRKLL